MKLYNNDYQKTKYFLNTLDPKFLMAHTGYSKDDISKFKNRDNLQSKTIEKFISLSSNLNLEQILHLYYQNQPLPIDWENQTLINLNTQDDLINFTLLLKTINNNPLMISRIELYLKAPKENILIEKLFNALFPFDEARNTLKTNHSLYLHKVLTSELTSKGSKIFEFYGDPISEIKTDEFHDLIQIAKDEGLNPENFISDYLTKTATYILNHFRSRTYEDYFNISNGVYADMYDDNGIISVPELIASLNLNPEPFLLFDILNQYNMYINNPSYSEALVTYEDGTKGYESIFTEDNDFLDTYFLDKSNLSPQIISKLLTIGFIEKDNSLRLDFNQK